MKRESSVIISLVCPIPQDRVLPGSQERDSVLQEDLSQIFLNVLLVSWRGQQDAGRTAIRLRISMDISLFEEACGRTRTGADDDESRGTMAEVRRSVLRQQPVPLTSKLRTLTDLICFLFDTSHRIPVFPTRDTARVQRYLFQ